MTKKERVLAAIAHKQTDKVPKGELYIESNIANKLIDKNYPLDYQHFDREKEVRELLHMDLVNLGEWPSEKIGTDHNSRTIYRSVYGYDFKSTGLSKHVVRPPISNIEDAKKYPDPRGKIMEFEIAKTMKFIDNGAEGITITDAIPSENALAMYNFAENYKPNNN